ncbi:hypothetical protein HWV62_42757 [Athelia sp. TMB]|nr:hypothetical protein HWV62_42757 [Athelia sp. TMB]
MLLRRGLHSSPKARTSLSFTPHDTFRPAALPLEVVALVKAQERMHFSTSSRTGMEKGRMMAMGEMVTRGVYASAGVQVADGADKSRCSLIDASALAASPSHANGRKRPLSSPAERKPENLAEPLPALIESAPRQRAPSFQAEARPEGRRKSAARPSALELGTERFIRPVGRVASGLECGDAALTAPSASMHRSTVVGNRRHTLARVQEAVSWRYGDTYTVQMFGSAAYGVCDAKSDLDLVIVDPSMPFGWAPGAEPRRKEIYNIRHLANTLRKAGFIAVIPVPATVPIVKFRDPATGLACDINVNERLGLRNTRLIGTYMALVPLLRPLVAYLKRWARLHELNSPAGGLGTGPTFSSYALVLMTIAFLQARGLAPNLQEGVDTHKRSFFWIKEKRRRGADAGQTRCETSYHRGDEWVKSSYQHKEFRDAVIQWFRYWAQEHDYSGVVANIRQGGFISKVAEDNMRHRANAQDAVILPKAALEDKLVSEQDAYIFVSEIGLASEGKPAPQVEVPTWLDVPICVMDPFIHTKIVTRAIVEPQRERFRSACTAAAGALERGQKLFKLVNPEDESASASRPTGTMRKFSSLRRVVKDGEHPHKTLPTRLSAQERGARVQTLRPKRPSTEIVLEEPQTEYVPSKMADESEALGRTRS